MPGLDIPEFLKIPQADRAKAWEGKRLTLPNALPTQREVRRIPDPPGEPLKVNDDE